MSDEITPPPSDAKASAPVPPPTPAPAPAAAPVYVAAGYPGAKPPKSLGVAYVLWFFLGIIGVHHFYMGKIGRGILWLLTLGLAGIGWLWDLFTLPGQMRQVNAQRAVGI